MSVGVQLDLQPWLDELLSHVQQLPRSEEPDLFELLTIGSAERVNSNMLAFYLDREAHHGFEGLFLDALLDLVREKSKDNGSIATDLEKVGVTNYTIRTEARVAGKSIDILLLGEHDSEDEGEQALNKGSWALIIENKLYAALYNDLVTYWNEIDAPNKIGVVLSLRPLEGSEKAKLINEGMVYTNVLHTELVDRVRLRLPAYFLGSNDRHLLILKEYFKNITSHYAQDVMTEENEHALLALKKEAAKVRALDGSIAKLRAYVIHAYVTAFQQFGFEPSSRIKAAKASLFWPKAELAEANGQPYITYFRFWVNFDRMLFDRKMECVFELDKPHTGHGMELREWVEDQKLVDKTGLTIGDDGVVGGGYFHIAWLWEVELPNDGELSDLIHKQLLDNFFNPTDHFVKKCIEKMDELTKTV